MCFVDWGCTCNKVCPIHPTYYWPTTTTDSVIWSEEYKPKHRKPGPAQ